ncbi:hypothetical protein RRG08_031531 [Elysia crispata]|uniref:Uncharacterized protein n=1 Tax=Elysia crispata TaxID=231223 RepID=A0AAE1D9A1_9GAST|nr:hypothetical protein RRG08_031531 [Elysia crispata]
MFVSALEKTDNMFVSALEKTDNMFVSALEKTDNIFVSALEKTDNMFVSRTTPVGRSEQQDTKYQLEYRALYFGSETRFVSPWWDIHFESVVMIIVESYVTRRGRSDAVMGFPPSKYLHVCDQFPSCIPWSGLERRGESKASTNISSCQKCPSLLNLDSNLSRHTL